jgi:hypothetical protein
MDQKNIRNTINSLLKNKLVVDSINEEYPGADITTKTFSISKSTVKEKKGNNQKKSTEDTLSITTLHYIQDQIPKFSFGGSKDLSGNEGVAEPNEVDASVRAQITHLYMFLNFYFLKVAIEKPFIKGPREPAFSLIYTSEPYQHPVTSNEYLESSLAEYDAIFSEIRPLLTTDVLKTDINKNIMSAAFKTTTFHTTVKKIKGGAGYERRGQTVKYRRSTRHRKKHRRTTSKWRPRYTSKRRPANKKNYTMKNK